MGSLQQTLYLASIAFFVIAGVCFAVALALFFLKDIRGVRNYLTGKTLREAVERMGASGSSHGKRKASGASPKRQSEKVGGNASVSGNVPSEASSGPIRHVEPAAAERAESEDAAMPSGSPGSRLRNGQTAAYEDDAGETTTLYEAASSTTLLQQERSGEGVTDLGECSFEKVSAVDFDGVDDGDGNEGPPDFAIVKKLFLTDGKWAIPAQAGNEEQERGQNGD